MGFSMSLALGDQTTAVLVALYRKLPNKIDDKGEVNPLAINILGYLGRRGYDVRGLVYSTF